MCVYCVAVLIYTSYLIIDLEEHLVFNSSNLPFKVVQTGFKHSRNLLGHHFHARNMLVVLKKICLIIYSAFWIKFYTKLEQRWCACAIMTARSKKNISSLQ